MMLSTVDYSAKYCSLSVPTWLEGLENTKYRNGKKKPEIFSEIIRSLLGALCVCLCACVFNNPPYLRKYDVRLGSVYELSHPFRDI